MNVIKQIIKDGEYGTQTIKQIVRSNERGPQGEQGEPGEAATISAGQAYTVPSDQNPAVINTGTSSNAVFDFYIPQGEKGDPGMDGKDGENGKDGAIQYTAGTGIEITADNEIRATGSAEATWGSITGTLSNQTDLQNALDAKQGVLTAGDSITISDDVISAVIAGGSVFVGTCSTAGDVAAKVATISADQNFALKKGAVVAVKFANTNSAYNVTIDVNGTGAKSIYYTNSVYTGASSNVAGYASRYIYYMYDGTYWVWLNTGQESDTTYSTMSVSEGTTGTATSARTMRADYLKQIIQYYTPTITMTTTDPGEGASLAANNFIAVYS